MVTLFSSVGLCRRKLSSTPKKTRTQRSIWTPCCPGLQTEIDETDQKLEETKAELAFFMSYKDKEYPVKALEIFSLQTEVSDVKQLHQVKDT